MTKCSVMLSVDNELNVLTTVLPIQASKGKLRLNLAQDKIRTYVLFDFDFSVRKVTFRRCCYCCTYNIIMLLFSYALFQNNIQCARTKNCSEDTVHKINYVLKRSTSRILLADLWVT